MKHTTKKTIPSRIVEEVYRVTCDICKANIKDNGFDVDEVKIRQETGYRCSDGSQIIKKEFDICPACFTSKIVPFLESLGARPTESEIDY